MRNLIIACTIPVTLALPALAGSMDQPVMEEVIATPAPTPALDYDWTGFYGGLSIGTGSGEVENGGASADFDVDSSYGLYGGYLWDNGPIVYGAELAYSSLEVSPEGGGGSADGDVLALKGRVGYDGGRFMPYATAGFANLNLEDESGSGYVYGLGMEFAATDSVRVRGEYLAHDFSDFGDTDGTDVSADTFNLGLSYAF